MAVAATSTDAAGLARLMGLRQAEGINDLALVQRVERGLPVAAAERVAQRLDPGDPTIVYAIIPKSSLARRKAANQPLSREQSERVMAMAKVVAEALTLWKDDAGAAHRFLNRPHPVLEGRTPFDVAKESIPGADLVVRLIGKARAGVAV